MKHEILKIDQLTESGNIYTRECADAMVKEFNSRHRSQFGYLGFSKKPHVSEMNRAAHLVSDLSIEENGVLAEIIPLSNHNGNILREMLDSGLVEFKPSVLVEKSCVERIDNADVTIIEKCTIVNVCAVAKKSENEIIDAS